MFSYCVNTIGTIVTERKGAVVIVTVADEEAGRPQISAMWLSQRLDESSAQGIAAAVNKLIRAGTIAAGSQLPTVRALAKRMEVSPATVSTAWNMLRKQRIIEGTGRQGTWVLNEPTRLAPTRFESIFHYWKGGVLDLTLAVPDPALLPDIANAVRHAEPDPELNQYKRPSITDSLRKAAESTWPWTPEGWLAVNGGYEGLMLLLSSNIVPGDYVAVADPSAPRLLDILEHLGARVLPIATDEHGPIPDILERVLDKQPAAFIYEPRASSRLGVSVGTERRNQLAKVLSSSKMLIIEDDGLGELAADPYFGLGPLLPNQTVLVRSYSKSHGPDLRLAVLGGSDAAIARARDIRQFGAGWTSRLLQNALAWMLLDPETQQLLDAARNEYARRRKAMTGLLAERGVTVGNRDGLSLSVPVRSEPQALLVLASHGIAADGNSGSAVRAHAPMIRLGLGNDFDDPVRIADAYAMAARAF
jgi:DNA-binding transcriptional MocR family regulator